MAIAPGIKPGPIAFAGSPIERADLIRVNPDALASHMNWRARVLLLDGLLPQIDDTGGLLWGTLADVDPATELVFLGLLDGKACFAPAPGEGATGPAYAMPRVWAAIIENYRNADGSVTVPEALRPYMRGIDRIGPPGAD